MIKRFTMLIGVSLVLVIACKPAQTPRGGDSPSSAPKRPPNTRTNLEADPPTIKEGGLAFEQQPPAEKGPTNELVGEFDDLDKIPLAYITFKNTPEWCSGVLVSDKNAHSYIVVTAAHCFWDDYERYYEPKQVFLLTKSGQWKEAPIYLFHRSDIDEYEFKDIGLIRLKNQPPIDTFDPIDIAVRSAEKDAAGENTRKKNELKPGTKVFSWGYTSRRWIERQTILTTGAKYQGPDFGRKIRQWLIPTKNAPALGGDSGGPLVIKVNNKWLLVGVLQGLKPGGLYTDELAITFSWVDVFMQKIWDANGDERSVGMARPINLDANFLLETR